MKKIIIAASLLAVALTSNAQDTYKFVAGDNNLELNFKPLSGAPIGMGNIKYRRFLSESLALRIGLGFSFQSDVEAKDINDPNSIAIPQAKIELNKTTTAFGWNISPGFEKHFAGTERLSPYLGAELVFGMNTSMEKDERYNLTTKGVETTTTKGTDGSLNFGLNALAGFDYYFAKRLYAGAELGLGFGVISKSEVTVEDTQAGFVAPAPTRQGGTINFAPGVNTAIRLGFLF